VGWAPCWPMNMAIPLPESFEDNVYLLWCFCVSSTWTSCAFFSVSNCNSYCNNTLQLKSHQPLFPWLYTRGEQSCLLPDLYLTAFCPSAIANWLRIMIRSVPPRPEDVTVPVIVLFTIVSSCVTDCNCNIVRCPCNGPVREVSPSASHWHYITSPKHYALMVYLCGIHWCSWSQLV